MYMRDEPTLTLAEVKKDLTNRDGLSTQVENAEIRVDLKENKVIGLGKIEVPATPGGVAALGDWLEVPSKFLGRLDAEMQEYLLSGLLNKQAAAIANVHYRKGEGIDMVRDINSKFIEPLRVVNIAAKVIDNRAPVVDFWSTKDEFRLDVIAPENFDRGIGGDKKVGDITRGGIRIVQDVKHNHAPSVSEYLYRLVCTNGMERYDEGLKVDARGQTVDEVLAELEIMADLAFRRVENSIASLYDLREQKVDNPERTLIRMAEENGVSGRTVLEMAEVIPAMAHDDVSMFDLVNLITNQANAPGMKAGPRRTLERAGGTIVGEHADRCSHCQSRLDPH